MNFTQLFAHYQDRVNNTLSRFIFSLPSKHSLLVIAMQYGVLSRGKRIRPFLVYTVGKMFDVNEESLDAPAAAVESIHAYSLIHDDLPAMDNNSLRRGQPTCHIKFGEDIAILTGDALQTLAFSILTDLPMHNVRTQDRIAMISELAKASGVAGMCGGQALDLTAKRKKITDLVTLEEIHRNKAGALIRSAIRLGALASGTRAYDALPLLDRYAEAIGLAFQIQDDILDVIEDTNTNVIGKQDVDKKLGKNTYPALMGMDNARRKAHILFQDAMNALDQLTMLSLNVSILRDLASFIIKRDK